MDDSHARSDRVDRSDGGAPGAGHGQRGTGSGEISVFQLISVLVKHRYTVLGMVLGTVVLVVSHTLITFEPLYTSRSSFIPQRAQRSSVDGLEAVAGQLGISVQRDGASESPEFYADLLRSHEILQHVLTDTFTVAAPREGGAGPVTGTLLGLLEIDAGSDALRREAGLNWLDNAITPAVSRETSLVTFSVTTPWPNVSRAIGERLLQLVNEFNLRTRQSQAAAERAFIEGRLVEARSELAAAEDDLKRFLENNRQFRNSPDLVFEHDRLQRRVATRQQVFTWLSQSYEQSRIAQVRDTPLITVVEPPREPVSRNPRGLALRGIMAIILGTTLGVFVAFGREVVERSRADGDPGYQAFHEVWEDARSDVRRVVSGLRRSSRVDV